jgi:hypothetical protein
LKLLTGRFPRYRVSDLALNTNGGAQAAALSDVVHADVINVDMPGVTWSGMLNLNESNGVRLDNIYLHSTSSEEFDQARHVTFVNSKLLLEAGSNQFVFSEGASGITVANNSITSTDRYAGLRPCRFRPSGCAYLFRRRH